MVDSSTDDCSLRMKKNHPYDHSGLRHLVSSLPIISSRHGISCSTEAWSYRFWGERWPLKCKIGNEVARPMTYSDQIGLFHSIPASFQTWVVLPSFSVYFRPIPLNITHPHIRKDTKRPTNPIKLPSTCWTSLARKHMIKQTFILTAAGIFNWLTYRLSSI